MGYRVTGLPGYRVTGLPGYRHRVTGLPGYRVTGTGLRGYRVTGTRLPAHLDFTAKNHQALYSYHPPFVIVAFILIRNPVLVTRKPGAYVNDLES